MHDGRVCAIDGERAYFITGAVSSMVLRRRGRNGHVHNCSGVDRLASLQVFVKIELATVDVFILKFSAVISLITIRQKTRSMVGVFVQEMEHMPVSCARVSLIW